MGKVLNGAVEFLRSHSREIQTVEIERDNIYHLVVFVESTEKRNVWFLACVFNTASIYRCLTQFGKLLLEFLGRMAGYFRKLSAVLPNQIKMITKWFQGLIQNCREWGESFLPFISSKILDGGYFEGRELP